MLLVFTIKIRYFSFYKMKIKEDVNAEVMQEKIFVEIFSFKQNFGVLAGVAQCTECWPKGHWFDSQSGHMPGLQARSPLGVT